MYVDFKIKYVNLRLTLTKGANMYLDDMEGLKQMAKEMIEDEKLQKLEDDQATMWMPWE
jgi:hypothetical protein